MKEIISNLLESYELGKLDRRQLIQGLAAIAASACATPADASTFQGRALTVGVWFTLDTRRGTNHGSEQRRRSWRLSFKRSRNLCRSVPGMLQWKFRDDSASSSPGRADLCG
jgi:hypothetical protein